ncbi:hypothetical protein R75461_08112 [Paraburkholderia nemoris]|uniref:hypothetical protein n=1 Tax=Paraburkholderia nemoris TaxID=2793076 RepID=UPI00190AD74A|nr:MULTISPECIES: hypothetical protein [Paraburkholderia]MBK3786746.1 hypothetical protein [Paraburkholderia aspalathi]CAE6863446.1 hypothetical protein R75461_08112 [Paraburkholderia nemoris]
MNRSIPQYVDESSSTGSLFHLLDKFMEGVRVAHRMHYEHIVSLVALVESLDSDCITATERDALFARMEETTVHLELNERINIGAFRGIRNRLLRHLVGAPGHDTDCGALYHACRIAPSTDTQH